MENSHVTVYFSNGGFVRLDCDSRPLDEIIREFNAPIDRIALVSDTTTFNFYAKEESEK